MAVVRWNPWNDLFHLQNQVDQLFQSVTGDFGQPSGTTDLMNVPVDIRQTDSEFVIEASAPGFRPEDVEITFEDGMLTLRGQRSVEHDEKQGEYIRRERRTATLYRRISLPAEVAADDISATFENGVLRITVPRAQKAQPRRIPVAANGSEQQPARVDSQTSPEQTQKS
jgi:HSP20 family protein